MTDVFLPYGRQVIENDDIAEVVRVLHSDMLTAGPEVPAFEGRFAEAVGAEHAIACNNGTAALHLAVMASGLGPGDWAVVPSITFLATANVVRMCGAEVVFADVEPNTGLMTAETFEDARAKARGPVKAVLPVHLAGQSVGMADLVEAAARADCTIIEDACHAIGASSLTREGEKPIGSCWHGGYAAFSLHPVKTITTGEGGVVTTASPDAARRLAQLRSHGMVREVADFSERDLAIDAGGTPNPWYYEMHELGWNYRLTDVQAALGLTQLGKLQHFLDVRRKLRDAYRQELSRLAPLVRLSPSLPTGRPGWHLAVALIDFEAAGTSRATLMASLRQDGIGTQVHYIPVHRQPYYKRRYGAASLPGADAWYARCLSLPLFPSMKQSDVSRVVDALARALDAGK